jgi:hypothetical protein
LDIGESRSPTQIFQRNLLLASHRLWAYVCAFGPGLMVMIALAMAMVSVIRLNLFQYFRRGVDESLLDSKTRAINNRALTVFSPVSSPVHGQSRPSVPNYYMHIQGSCSLIFFSMSYPNTFPMLLVHARHPCLPPPRYLQYHSQVGYG